MRNHQQSFELNALASRKQSGMKPRILDWATKGAVSTLAGTGDTGRGPDVGEKSRVHAEMSPRSPGRGVQWTEVSIGLDLRKVCWTKDLHCGHHTWLLSDNIEDLRLGRNQMKIRGLCQRSEKHPPWRNLFKSLKKAVGKKARNTAGERNQEEHLFEKKGGFPWWSSG